MRLAPDIYMYTIEGDRETDETYTPAGSNVQVNPDHAVSVTFSQVTQSGDTTVNIATNNPGHNKSGFRFLGKYYDIVTTATTPEIGKIKYINNFMQVISV